MKSIRLRIAARIVGFGGTLACFIAAVIWQLLVYFEKVSYQKMELFGYTLLPTDLMILIAAAVVFIIVGIVLGGCAKHARKKEAEAFAKEDTNEDDFVEESCAPIVSPEDVVPEKKNPVDTIKEKAKPAVEMVKKNAKIILPAAASVVAIAVLAGLAGKKKKKKKQMVIIHGWIEK